MFADTFRLRETTEMKAEESRQSLGDLLLLFKQMRMQFKPTKDDSSVEWVPKNDS